MRKIILFSLISIFALKVSAQNLVADTDSSYKVGFPSDFLITCDNHVTNQSGTTLNIKWVRTEESLPAGWSTTVCDKNTCYSSSTNIQTYTSNNNDKDLLKVNFAPAGTEGTGVVRLNVFSTSDSANTNTVAYYIAKSDINASTSVQKVKDFVIYPTPVRSNMFIAYNSSIDPTKVEIYNVLGQKVKTILIENERANNKIELDLSMLNKGLYFARVYTSGSSAVLTKQFTKE